MRNKRSSEEKVQTLTASRRGFLQAAGVTAMGGALGSDLCWTS